MGVLEMADLEKFGADAAAITTSASDKYMERFLRSFDDQKVTIQAFKDALSELPELLATKSEDAQPTNRPLVIIIDELDRCSPTFALSVLERMKHFFSVPNVHFVLGANLHQLQNSVRAAYGDHIDAVGYLHKFVHVSMPLMDVAGKPEGSNAEKYILHLSSAMGARQDQQRLVNYFAELLTGLALAKRLTFRQIERAHTVFAMVVASISPNALVVPPILAGLCVLKIMRPDLYKQAKTGEIRFGDVEEALSFAFLQRGFADREVAEEFRNYWRMVTGEVVSDEKFRNHIVRNFTPEQQRAMLVRTANQQIDRFLLSEQS